MPDEKDHYRTSAHAFVLCCKNVFSFSLSVYFCLLCLLCFSLSFFFSFSFFPICISPFSSFLLLFSTCSFSVCFSTSFPFAKSVLLMKSSHIIHSFYTCPLTFNLLQDLHQPPQDVPLNWPTSSQTTFIFFFLHLYQTDVLTTPCGSKPDGCEHRCVRAQ